MGKAVELKGVGKIAEEPWRPLKFEAAWVETKNERRFLAMMEVIRQGIGEGRFGVVWDQAGRGKTKTTARWAAHQGVAHLRMVEVWKSSELGFLQALCRELKVLKPPFSKNGCFLAALEKLLEIPADRRVVFLDEMDRLPKYLGLVRDLADLSGAAFILIGEEQMPGLMAANRRVWSRTLDGVRFEAVEAPDLLAYGWASAGLKIEPAAAALLNQAAGGGDWRVIRKRTLKMTALANSRRSREISPDLARLVLEEELRDQRR